MGHCLSRKGQSRRSSLTLLCSLRSPRGGNDPGARAEPGPPALQGARSPSWLHKLQRHGHRGFRVERGWGGAASCREPGLLAGQEPFASTCHDPSGLLPLLPPARACLCAWGAELQAPALPWGTDRPHRPLPTSPGQRAPVSAPGSRQAPFCSNQPPAPACRGG